jgi:2-oxoglutarate ferredoxin oxidoreductase subunit alpha
MTERVVIPEAGEIHVEQRRVYDGPKEDFRPFQPISDGVPPMVTAGTGYHVHVTGLTHDERGYPAMTVSAQGRLVRRLLDKVSTHADDIMDIREDGTEGADVVVVTYGITSRTAIPAIERARAQGLKVGHLRLVVVWPFPEERIRALASSVRAIVVPELNFGQIVLEVERCAAGKVPVTLVGHAGGAVHQPEDIFNAILKSVKGR